MCPPHKSLTSSPFSLLLSHARLVRSDKGHRRASRFLLRGLFHWSETIDWLRFIDTHAELKNAPEKIRRVIGDKIHRPFSQCGLSVRARVDLLKTHYEILEKFFSPEALAALVAEEPMTLARLRSKNETDFFSITLSRSMISQHQGELALLLIDETENVALARLLLNVTKDEAGKTIVLLNGTQGPHPDYRARIVRVTRDLYGLRPKRALVEVAAAFTEWLQSDTMIAIAKKNHVSQTRAKWQRKVVADYDDFWDEFSTETLPSGNQKIPLPLPRRNIDDVIPKKRKDWQRRCALEDQLHADTLSAFSASPSLRGALLCGNLR